MSTGRQLALFAGKREAVAAAPADGKVDTIIGRETELKGTLTSSGLIRIDGKVDGEIVHSGDIAVGETGQLTANIKARNITVAGTINGNIQATGRLELLPTARVFGDIVVASLVIGDGAVFQGSSAMKQSTADSSASGPSV